MSSAQEIVERALLLSRSDGCVVIADALSSANLRWANNALTTNGVVSAYQLTVIATVAGATGTASGVVSRGGVRLAGIEDVVAAAEAVARASPAAEDAEPLVEADGADPDWGEPPEETSARVFGSFAPALGEAFDRARGGGVLLFGYAQHEHRSTYLGSSTGLRRRYDQPTGHVQINAKSSDLSRSCWAGAATSDFAAQDVMALEAQLVERLGWAARQLELPPGRYETLLPPSAVADLMICLYWAMGGRDAHDGRSVFSRPGGGLRIGERLSEVPLSLRSDPAASGMGCSPFVVARSSHPAESVFDNGLTLAPTSWINDGILAALVQTRHSAALTGTAVTPAIDNLIMDGPAGGRPLADMVDSTTHGLLLTCLWYIRTVDPRTLLVTGLTRDGVYLVEGGEVVGAVNNFRFNESPLDLLSRTAEVGATARTLPREWSDYFTRTAMPPLRVDGFNMSSTSQAS